MTVALGIDPGLNGALGLICSIRGLLEVESIPTCHNGAGEKATIRRKVDAVALAKLWREWSTKHCLASDHVAMVVERMAPFTGGPGSTTLLSLGHSAGVIEGVLAPLAREFHQVLPQQWKKTFGLGKDKGASLDTARRLYPAAADRLTRQKDNDKAEAILLAHWLLMDAFA